MEITTPETISQELCALVHKKCSARSTHIRQARHPGAVLGGDVRETEMSLYSCREHGSAHGRLSSLPRESVWTLPKLFPVFAFPSGFLTTQCRVGRSVRGHSPSEQHWGVLWLSEPVHDLLTPHCSLGRDRGATRKDLAASGMDTQGLSLHLCPGLLPTHSTGRRDHSGDQKFQGHWQPP